MAVMQMPTKNRVTNTYVTLVIRNDSSDNLTDMNPVLRQGELCAEIDTKLLKIGDGRTRYNNLPYINIPISIATDTEAGIVLSAAAEDILIDDSNNIDPIFVQNNGLMQITQVSTNKLYIPENDNLVLFCGDATL